MQSSCKEPSSSQNTHSINNYIHPHIYAQEDTESHKATCIDFIDARGRDFSAENV